jgi:hypothetical protein
VSNNRLETRSHEGDTLWAVTCDSCPRQAPASTDPGNAAEKARKAGFITKPRGVGEPKAWECPACRGVRANPAN